jgi:hypothetical protein
VFRHRSSGFEKMRACKIIIWGVAGKLHEALEDQYLGNFICLNFAY